MLTPTVVLQSSDIVHSEHQQRSLNFDTLIKPATKKAECESANPNFALAKTQFETTLTEMKEATWFKKISSPSLYFFTNENELHKHAVKLCLEDSLIKGQQAQLAIEQAQINLQTLNKALTEVKAELADLNQLRKDAAVNVPLLQTKIDQNLAEIKAIEPILGSAITKIYYSVLTAQAMDPKLVKQPFELKQQPIESLVLNKDKYINNTEIFLSASQIVQDNSASRNQLKETLAEKLSVYENIKAAHEAFKKTLPTDLSKLSPEQINEATHRGEALKNAILEYDAVKKQLNTQLEQAKEYLKYHDIWSKQTQEEIDTAKSIESKKLDNIKLSQTVEQIMEQTSDQKLALLTEKLQSLEEQFNIQEKIASENQQLFKMQQDFSCYFQQEAHKLEALTESEVHIDITATPPAAFMPISSGEKLITPINVDQHLV